LPDSSPDSNTESPPMPTTTARVVLITVLVLLGIGAILVHSPSAQVEPVWCDHCNHLTRSSEHHKEFEHRIGVVKRLSDTRSRIARLVLAGRLRLLEAAAIFQDLNECADFSKESFRVTFRGATDDERVCRQLIQFVRLEAGEDPKSDKLAASRLEQELQGLL